MEIIYIKNLALILAISSFAIYVAYVWGKYGVQSSISISFYDFPDNQRFAFRVFIFILSLSIIIAGIGWDIIWFYLSGGCLSLVGIFARVHNKVKKIIHSAGAIFGIIFAIFAIDTMQNNIAHYVIALIILQSIALVNFGKLKHAIWNIEITCFSYIILAILYIVNF